MYFFDPWYFILLAPGLLLAMWAQWRTHSAYAQGKQYRARSGLTGAQAAAAVMEAGGVTGVAIEPVEGMLTDHYDPRHKVLRLSPEVYGGNSLSSMGIAAHEAGHAIQDATQYPFLILRNGLVPFASVGSNMSWIILFVGLLLMRVDSVLGRWAIFIGIGLFSLTVLFQLINLPVEFDASKRARNILVNHGLITPDEDPVVRKVLGAAAMTYVAATLTAVLTLLYYVFRSGLLGGRSRD